MTPVLFLLWIILCERISFDEGMLQVLIIGAVVTAIVRTFMAKALNLTMRAEILFYRRLGYIFVYIFMLLWEVLKANFTVIRILLFRPKSIRPVIVKFCVPIHDDLARTLLSCAITLTPGTVTIGTKKNLYTVHCLDESLAEGLESSAFVRLLTRMDRLAAKDMPPDGKAESTKSAETAESTEEKKGETKS